MDYLIIKDEIIENIIVCDDEQTANFFGAVPSYAEARIGDKYNPPAQEETKTEAETALDMVLNAIIQ